jgi:spore maturation protein CgeD
MKATRNEQDNCPKPLSFSVIMTSYRRLHLAWRAIKSVRDQTWPHWELIVVDDNSGQAVSQALIEAFERDARCRLVSTSVSDAERSLSCRYSVCINIGLELASGDIITYLTDDDYYMPIRLERMADQFAGDPDIMVVYGNQLVLDLDESDRLVRVRG